MTISETRQPLVVLFDLDGTLVDTLELLLSSMRHAFTGREGEAPARDAWIAGIGTPLASQLRPYARDDADVETLRAAYRTYQIANHDRLTRCFPNVMATIQTLAQRGHRMGVVTSKATDIARRTLTYTGLAPYMEVLVAVEMTVRNKPDPEPVTHALAQFHAAPDHAVFVGDSPHDVVAGNAAGVTTIGALWGPFSRATLDAAKPHYLLERITALPALLDVIG